MTAHELARRLLDGPDLPVCVIGQEAAEGTTIDLSKIEELDALRRRNTFSSQAYYKTAGEEEAFDKDDLDEMQKQGGERLQIIRLS